MNPSVEIAGQMNVEERRILRDAVLNASRKPQAVIEIGTWLGGGSTLHLLRALQENNEGHLRLLSHDAKLRKGKWLVPYLSELDHWNCTLHDVSEEGLFDARKIRQTPSAASLTNAEKLLRRMRLNIFKLTGAFLPSGVNAFLLGLLPKPLVRRIGEGRK